MPTLDWLNRAEALTVADKVPYRVLDPVSEHGDGNPENLLIQGDNRDAIKRIGGTLPENIPPAEHIKEVVKRIKTATPKLTLDEREAGGLLGDAIDKHKDK